LAASQTFNRPVLLALVVPGYRGSASRNDQPWLLRRSEDVDIGWQVVGFVECADADESNERASTRVMAPHSDATRGATGDLLTVATFGRCEDQLRLRTQHRDSIGLDHRIECERRSTLALAPTAVTAVHEQRSGFHAIANVAAVAAAFERKQGGGTHGGLGGKPNSDVGVRCDGADCVGCGV